MSILVTGASGFLGGQLVQRLARETGDEIVLLTRSGADLSAIPSAVLEMCTVLTADGTDQIIEAVCDLAPHMVYHSASRVLTDHCQADVDDLIQSNLGLFTGLLEGLACSRQPVLRMVNLGTYLEHDETGAPNPNSLYAATKLAQAPIGDFYARNQTLRLITLKPSVIYGPHERRPRLMRILLETIQRGEMMALSPGEQVLDLVYVDDVVSAILTAGARVALGEDSMRETYFVLSGEALTLRETVARIEKVVGQNLSVEWGAKPYKHTEVMKPYCDGPTVPGWTARFTLECGVRAMLDAMQQEACRIS